MELAQFITEYETHNPDGMFFHHNSLKLFGKAKSRMYLQKRTVKVLDIYSKMHFCWCIRAKTKFRDGRMENVYHYFEKNTYKEVNAAVAF